MDNESVARNPRVVTTRDAAGGGPYLYPHPLALARSRAEAERVRLADSVAYSSMCSTWGRLGLGDAGADPVELLARHQSGDWGDLGGRDRLENERGVGQGMRLLSAYGLGANGAGRRVWIITEADRSCTCILLPEEY